MKRKAQQVYIARTVLILLAAILALGGSIRPAVADDAKDSQQLVDKARLTVEAFVADKEMGPPLKALL